MGGVSEILATIPVDAWVLFGMAAVGRSVFKAWPHIRYRFYKDRFERVSRQRYVPREEANYYRLSMGEEPEPLDVLQMIGRALVEGLIAGVPPWLATFKHDGLGLRLTGALIGIGLVIVTWRWLNDPDRKPPWQKAGIPQDAMLGFGAALVIVAVLLGAMLELF